MTAATSALPGASPFSLRTRLTLAIIAAVLLLSLLAGVTLLLVVRHRLTEDFDASLRAQAHALAAAVHREATGRVEFDALADAGSSSAAHAHPDYFQLRNPLRQTLRRSPSLQGRDLPLLAPSTHVTPFILPGGRPARAVCVAFTPSLDIEDRPPTSQQAAVNPPQANAQSLTLTLARDTTPITHTLSTLTWGLAAAALVMAGGAAAFVSVLATVALRPVRALADHAGRLDATTLSDRFPTQGLPAELTPIAVRLNELLSRLEASFGRERRFTSAAAHELRTPLAELRTLTEVALRWPEPAAQAGTLQNVLSITRTMESLATSLLALSRTQSGQDAAQLQPVQLRPIVERVWASLGGVQSRGRELRIQGIGDGRVLADPTMAEAVVRNLLENAIEYSPQGTVITCEVWPDGLAMANAQTGLTRADLAHVADPFWRKDAARSARGHAGLGLSLVRAYAAAMGARAEFSLDSDDAFRANVRFVADGAGSAKN